MKIKVDLWITPDGYRGEIIPGVGVAQHVKGTVEVPDEPVVALLAAISCIRAARSYRSAIVEARNFLEEAQREG